MPSNAQSLYLRAIFSYLYDIFRYFPSFLWQTSRSKHIRQIFAGRRKATSFSSMTPGRLHMEWEPMKHHIQLGMKIHNIRPMDVGYWINQWYWMFFLGWTSNILQYPTSIYETPMLFFALFYDDFALKRRRSRFGPIGHTGFIWLQLRLWGSQRLKSSAAWTNWGPWTWPFCGWEHDDMMTIQWDWGDVIFRSRTQIHIDSWSRSLLNHHLDDHLIISLKAQ